MRVLLGNLVFLDDRSATGRVRPWREKKIANELLAIAYDSVNPDKAARLRGVALTYRLQYNQTEKKGWWVWRVAE